MTLRLLLEDAALEMRACLGCKVEGRKQSLLRMEEVLGREGGDSEYSRSCRRQVSGEKKRLCEGRLGKESRDLGGPLYTLSSKANELEVSSAVAQTSAKLRTMETRWTRAANKRSQL